MLKAGDSPTSAGRFPEQTAAHFSQRENFHAANADLIRDPEKIRAGWTLQIPQYS